MTAHVSMTYHHRPLQLLFVSLVLALLSSRAHAQDRALTSGLSVGAGIGHESGFVGGHALYYFQLSDERYRLAPHVGLGAYPGTSKVGFAGGLMGSFGRRHRLVVDLLAAPYANISGKADDGKLRPGVGLLAGYEWMAPFGLAIRSTIGMAYRPTFQEEPLELAVNVLSIDYKFW